MRFAEEAPAPSERLSWPGPPESPRYLYVGQLIGDVNFQRPESQRRKGAADFFRWLAGVMAGDRQPRELQRPQSGTVDTQGRVYVTDSGRGAVFVFDPNTGELGVWERAEGFSNFVTPVGVAVGPNGQVFVADADRGIVARLDQQGHPGPSIGRGLLVRPTGLAYDAARGRLYVADTHAHDIKVFDAAGNLADTIGGHGDREGEFNFPAHVAFAHDEIYVSDAMNNRVQVFSADDHSFLRAFGSRGLYVGNMVRAKGVTVDSLGNVYVVESYYDHLLIYNRNGEFLMGIGGTGMQAGRFFLPAGAWVDARDRIYVADMFNGRVSVFQLLDGSSDSD